jgi:elongation factor P
MTATLDKREMQFVYLDGDGCVFLDTESDEQIALSREQLGEMPLFLKAGARARVVFCEGKPLGLEAPSLVELMVADTEPAASPTAAALRKPATLETGLRLMVPAFVDVGATVVVDTRTGEYRGLPYNGLTTQAD